MIIEMTTGDFFAFYEVVVISIGMTLAHKKGIWRQTSVAVGIGIRW